MEGREQKDSKRGALPLLAWIGLGCVLSFALVFLISYLYLKNRETEISTEASGVSESDGTGGSQGETAPGSSGAESGGTGIEGSAGTESTEAAGSTESMGVGQEGAESSEGEGEGGSTEAETRETESAESLSPESTEAESTELETSETEGTEPETSEPESTEPEPTPSPYIPSVSGHYVLEEIPEDQIDFGHLENYFLSWKIEEGDNFYERINGKSYRENPYVPLSSLRYLKLLHYNFNGNVQVGELIVNEDVVLDVIEIFQEMFRQGYQVESMRLVDDFWTGNPDSTDTASIEVNNTSAFNYRVVTGGGNLSKHAYGRAIDLNPQQNPYVSYSTGSPRWYHRNADAYIDRTTGLPHVITHSDLAYTLFVERGFRWGGDWNNPKDYQHFDREQRTAEAEKLHALEQAGALPSAAAVSLSSAG